LILNVLPVQGLAANSALVGSVILVDKDKSQGVTSMQSVRHALFESAHLDVSGRSSQGRRLGCHPESRQWAARSTNKG
jgi:hypothetical protein